MIKLRANRDTGIRNQKNIWKKKTEAKSHSTRFIML